jgi:hypothetical protein
MKDGEPVDQVSDYQLLGKGSAPWTYIFYNLKKLPI